MELEVNLLIVFALLLLACDFDDAALASWSLVTLKRPCKGLVGRCDDLVEREFDLTSDVMGLKVVGVV